jgi:hypothetical protein
MKRHGGRRDDRSHERWLDDYGRTELTGDTTADGRRNEYGGSLGDVTPGKRSMTQGLNVQRKGRGTVVDQTPETTHAIAARGIGDGGSSLPYLDRIQASFGPKHDVSRIKAHAGEAASDASRAIGAQAYAVGDHVAFRGAPDLHTAAHEAAHVVQQRAGVHLKDGVGSTGDEYEQQADAVADRVVAGESAEDLLDEVGDGGASSSQAQAVQRTPDDEAMAGEGTRGRKPDVVSNGYHSFYLRQMIPAKKSEVRLQIHQDPANARSATVAVWYEQTNTMQRVDLPVTTPIQPQIVDERQGGVRLDLDGDGVADLEVWASAQAQAVAIDFVVTYKGAQILKMTAWAPEKRKVTRRGIYMGELPDGRSYYLVPGSTAHPNGPFFVDDNGMMVNPGLEAQGAAISDMFRDFFVGWSILSASVAAVALAAPAIAKAGAFWAGKAAGATVIDAFIDFAIAALLALPAPGAGDHIVNFLINLAPYLGEAKKAKKIAKLLKIIDKVVEPIKAMAKVPGAQKLAKKIAKAAEALRVNLVAGKLDEAKQAFYNLLGSVREAQVATKLEQQGAKVVHMGKEVKKGGKVLTDLDVVTEEGGQLFINQVKAGDAVVKGPGSNSWKELENQVLRTKEAATELGGAKVRYYVDDISKEAKELFERNGFEVIINGRFLN